MSDTFLLRYPIDDTDAECAWLRVDATAAAHGPAGRGAFADAAVAAAGARVIWILPGDVVALAQPQLPPKSGKRLATLVPFALEDQLAADFDTLHFATGRQAEDGTVETALIDRATLEVGLATLTAHALAPVAAYGALQVTPCIPATTVLLIEGMRIHVRAADGAAYCTDLIPGRSTRQCLSLELTEQGPCVLYTTSASFYAREGVASPDDALPEGCVYVGGGPQLLEFGPLQKYAEVALRQPPVNLLQGSYTPSGQAAAGWARWRVAAFVLLACVLLNVLASGVDLVLAHRQSARLDTALHAAYAQALPAADPARMPAPRLVVEARVRRLMGAGHDGLIGALEALGSAVVATPGATVKSIQSHDGAMEAIITAADLATLNQLQQAVGPAARLAGVSTPDAQHAEGRLEINGGAP